MSFLADQLYPALDAGDSGLLDHLNPRRRSRAWSLDCPACGHKGAAYYYPGSPVVCCGRKKHCGKHTLLWEIAADRYQTGTDKLATLAKLCDLAQIEMPTRQPTSDPETQLAIAARACLREALRNTPRATDYIEKTRQYARDAWVNLDPGYYPSNRWLLAALRQRNAPLDIARRWHLVAEEGTDTAKTLHTMRDRLVGFWRQPGGGLGLWGRVLDDERTPKYCNTPELDKTIPYNYRRPRSGHVNCVEGPTDSWALTSLGVPGCATGGASLTRAQALFLASEGVSSVTYCIDGDAAGDKGALDTIAVAEPLGISTFFARPPDGTDVDLLRRQGRGDEILAMLERAESGGALLARLLLSAGDSFRSDYERLRKAYLLRGALTAFSTAALDRLLANAGVQLRGPRSEALAALSRMLDEGLMFDDAQAAISRRYGLTITITDAHG